MDTIGSLCFVNPLESTVPRKYSGGLDFPKILLFKSKGPYGEGILIFPPTCPAKGKNRSRPRKTVWKGRISLSSYVLLRRTCQPSKVCVERSSSVTYAEWHAPTVAIWLPPVELPGGSCLTHIPTLLSGGSFPMCSQGQKNAAGERERIKRSFKLKKLGILRMGPRH